MVIGIIQWVIISFVLIMLVHHLYSFFKNTLTVPKVKDMVHQPTKLYNEIEQTLQSADNNNTVKLSSHNNNDTNNIDTKIQPKTKKANDMFASFKSYNRKGTGGSKSMNKNFVLRQNANRYSYSGKVSQYPILKTDDYKIEKPMEKMDYETFKKLMAKKN